MLKQCEIIISIVAHLWRQVVGNNNELSNDGLCSFGDDEGIHFCIKVDADSFGYEKDGMTYHPEWCRRVIRYSHIIILKSGAVFCYDDDEHFPESYIDCVSYNVRDWAIQRGRDTLYDLCVKCYREAVDGIPEEHRHKPEDITHVNFNKLHDHVSESYVVISMKILIQNGKPSVISNS